jgi:alpha-galactosidase
MIKKAKIVLVGGGSVQWSPTLINDLLRTKGLEECRYVIHDIDEPTGQDMVKFGNKLAQERGLGCTFEYALTQSEAFPGADFIVITISTGDFDAMEHDIAIPEEYGILQTVGDTVGPGGWARGLRNIKVFAEMAENIEKLAPNAVVLNYTNPMATLTNVFYKKSSLRTVGLCHGLFELYALLQNLLGIDREDRIKVRFGGTNHFFWVLDLKIDGCDGYSMLREKLGGKSFDEVCNDHYVDGAGFTSGNRVASELLEMTGLLPYNGDRHICEFFSHYLTRGIERLNSYGLKRTSVSQRRENKADGRKILAEYLSGERKLPEKRSREIAADIIQSFITGREFIDVVNLPNQGQIGNLPAGSIVETLGVVNSLGFTPISAGNLPEPVLSMVLPHVINQDLIVEAGLTGNLEQALYALYNDPLCRHLTFPEIKEMGMRLLRAHAKFMPQFSL